MWTTVTETLLFLCNLVVKCPFIRAPLPNGDQRSSVSTIETVLDRVNTALRGIQRSMRAQPSKECHARHAERDTCCVEKCGTYERMNVGARKL